MHAMLLSDGNACQKIRVRNVNGSSVAKRSRRPGTKLAATGGEYEQRPHAPRNPRCGLIGATQHHEEAGCVSAAGAARIRDVSRWVIEKEIRMGKNKQ
jgi:hypothetical protein